MTSSKRKQSEELFSNCLKGAAYTTIKVANFEYTWTIRNFSFCTQTVGEPLNSPIFPIGTEDAPKWNLMLFPKGRRDNSKFYVGIYLVANLNTFKKVAIQTKFKISVLNKQGNEIVSDEAQFRFATAEGTVENLGGGFAEFIRQDYLLNKENEAVPDDTLTVRCNIAASWNTESISHQITIPELLLPDDLQFLFENPQFSDLTVTVNGKDFQVHKAILAARSPVFRAMLNTDMQESQTQRIEITDLDENVISEVLRFIYTGTVSNLEETPGDILKAADKYDLTRLKSMCEEELGRQLSITNAVNIFELAEFYGANQLKLQAKQFILLNPKDVANTSDYKTMVRKSPELAIEIFNLL